MSIADSTADTIDEIYDTKYDFKNADDTEKYWMYVYRNIMNRIRYYECTDLVINEYCKSYFSCEDSKALDKLVNVLACIYREDLTYTKRYSIDKGEVNRITISHKDRKQIFSFQYYEPN